MEELYVGTKRFKREANTLFRSLQVAYGAAAMPRGNVSSIYDWGVRVAAWVAPLIYKTALLGYLQRFPFHQTPPKVNFEKLKDHHADFERALVQSLKRTPFEEGLLKATQDRQE